MINLKKHKKKVKKPPVIVDSIYILEKLYIFLIIFFVATTVWDLSVTLTVAALEPEMFHEHEANISFSSAIAEGKPIYTLPGAVVHYLILFFYMYHYKKYKKYNRRWNALWFIILAGFIIILSALHVMGGYSWMAATIDMGCSQSTAVNTITPFDLNVSPGSELIVTEFKITMIENGSTGT